MVPPDREPRGGRSSRQPTPVPLDRRGNQGTDPRGAWPPQVRGDLVQLPCQEVLAELREGRGCPLQDLRGPECRLDPPAQAGTQQPEGGGPCPHPPAGGCWHTALPGANWRRQQCAR